MAFTEDQIEMAQELVKTGDVLGYQKLIIGELQREFGGSAEAFAKTAKGQFELVKNQVGNLQETMAEGLLPVVQKVFGKIIEILSDPKFVAVFQQISATIAAIADDLLSGDFGLAFDDFKEGLLGIGAALGISVESILAFTDGLTILVTTVKSFVNDVLIPFVQDHLEALKGALIAVGAVILGASVLGAIAALFNPITLIVGAVGLLGAAWAGDWGGIRDILTDFWVNTGQPIFETLKAWLQENIPIAIQTLTDFWTNTLQPAIQKVWEWMSTA